MEIDKNYRIAHNAVQFLEKHNLSAGPANYRFAYLFNKGSSKSVNEEVNYHIENGIRIRQEVVDEIMTAHQESNPNDEETMMEKQDTLEKFIEGVMEVSKVAQERAASASANMNEQVNAIRDGAEGKNLQESVNKIVQYTYDVERELVRASNKIQRLQRDLEEAQNRAKNDELTGIFNRRSANSRINELEMQKAEYSVAIIDIDHFKRINDNWGHAVGDRALKLVASHLEEELAPFMVARWGGEEFLIIAETNPTELAHKIRLAKETLKRKKVTVRSTNEPVGAITFTAGVVDAGKMGPDAAFEVADELLYKGKHSGRDIVMTEEQIPESKAA